MKATKRGKKLLQNLFVILNLARKEGIESEVSNKFHEWEKSRLDRMMREINSLPEKEITKIFGKPYNLFQEEKEVMEHPERIINKKNFVKIKDVDKEIDRENKLIKTGKAIIR